MSVNVNNCSIKKWVFLLTVSYWFVKSLIWKFNKKHKTVLLTLYTEHLLTDFNQTWYAVSILQSRSLYIFKVIGQGLIFYSKNMERSRAYIFLRSRSKWTLRLFFSCDNLVSSTLNVSLILTKLGIQIVVSWKVLKPIYFQGHRAKDEGLRDVHPPCGALVFRLNLL